MTKRQMVKRRSDLIVELCKLSRNGWRDARPVDYQPLEAELNIINAKLFPEIRVTISVTVPVR